MSIASSETLIGEKSGGREIAQARAPFWVKCLNRLCKALLSSEALPGFTPDIFSSLLRTLFLAK